MAVGFTPLKANPLRAPNRSAYDTSFAPTASTRMGTGIGQDYEPLPVTPGIAGAPGMIESGGWRFGQPNYQATSLGNQVGNELYNPETGGFQRTGAQKGTDAGQALKALAEASGLDLLGSSSSSGRSGGGAGGGVDTLAPIQMQDTSAANAAAFGRAKDQAGQTARASLTALRNEMASRGLRGSGIEAGEVGKTIERGAAGVNEFTREQAIQDVMSGDRRATQDYEGRITQRGQDISQRGQDLSNAQANASRQQQTLQGLLQMIGGRGILY